VCLLLLLGALVSGGASAAPFFFEQHEIALTPEAEQTLLTGFFLDGPVAEVAVVSVDEAGDRRLHIHGFEEKGWTPVLETTLSRSVLFVDVARIGARDRLLAYAPGRVSWLDLESGGERTLVELLADFHSPDGHVPRVDISKDLNRDGLDDLVVPQPDGFWVSIQRGGGSFTEPVKLGPAEPFLDETFVDGERSYGAVGITAETVPWYLSRVHQFDWDLDGRGDLVFWNADRFEVHVQGEDGLFGSAAESFAVEVPFDADGAYSALFGFADVGVGSMVFGLGEKTSRTVLYSMGDMNGDQIADLVTLTLSGRSPLRQRSTYDVHFGSRGSEGVVFAAVAGTTIEPRGKAGGLESWGYASRWEEDLDGDGQLDMVFRDVKTGFGGMLRTLTGRSVPIELEFYRLEAGAFPDEPSARVNVRPAVRPFRKGVFFPAVLMGDVNGDERMDLVVGKSRAELHVFFGVPGEGLLARQPQKVEVELPDDEGRTRLVDLNRDAKQDLLVHRPSDLDPGRVTLLIAR
jgi:hypothetical protein